MEFFEQLVIQLKSIYSKMSVSQRLSFGLVLVSVVICLGLVFFWSAKPDYVVLFSELADADAGKIHTKLAELDIPFKIAGTTIKVPSQHVYTARLQLANEGLPKGKSVGYEIFDKQTLGQTDYLQRLNFQRALEGELSRTISSLDLVEFARVHLVIPKPTIFSEEQESVSASIIVTTTGRILPRDKVVGITHLVSSSVEGLDPGNVTILDANGTLLSDMMQDNQAVSMTSSQLQMQKNIEKYLESKVSTLLTGVLGPGKSIVRVTADVDFSQNEKTQEKYNPESQVARSENRIEESAAQSGGTANSSVEKVITNYEINKTVEHIIGATGKIARLSLAVVVDGSYKIDKDAGKEGKIYVARTEEEKDSIKKLVITSLGISPNRGDAVEVINIPFDKSYLDEQKIELDRMRNMDRLRSALKEAGPWVIVIAIFVALFLSLQKVITQASLSKETVAGHGAFAGGGGGGGRPSMLAGIDRSTAAGEELYEKMRQEEAANREQEEAEAMAERMIRERMEEEVSSLATANPDAVAKIIKAWLKEG